MAHPNPSRDAVDPRGGRRPTDLATLGATLGVVATVLVSGAHCGPSLISEPTAPPPPPVELEEEQAPAAAPTWRYHPRGLGEIHDGVQLPDGTWLLAGEQGDRWQLTAAGKSPIDDSAVKYLAQPSTHRGPEPFLRVVRTSSGWLFVGKSGTPYVSQTPLGPLQASARPPEPLAPVLGSKDGLLGLTGDGRLLRFRTDEGWTPEDAPQRLFDLAASPTGELLGLGAPEILLTSADGANWAPVTGAAPLGALRLRQAAAGVLVEGVHETASWTAGAAGLQIPASDELADLPTNTNAWVQAERGPSAAAITAGRGVLTGRFYYEAIDREDDAETLDGGPGQGWVLAAGPLDGAPALRSVPGSDECQTVRIGAHGTGVIWACAQADEEDNTVVDVRRSRDGGKHWSKPQRLAAGDPDSIDIAMAPDGSALLTGVCLDKSRRGCSPRAPVLLGAKRLERITKSHAPELVEPPAAPAFSADGESAFVLGHRGKDDRVALFVSHDAGETFSARPLRNTGDLTIDQLGEQSLHPGADGQLGLVLSVGPPRYALADDDGSITHLAKLPRGTEAVSGHGRFVVALASPADEENDAPFQLWQSSDGGLSFVPADMPLRLDGLESDGGLWCADGGCVFGEIATRIGWGESAIGPPLLNRPRPLEPTMDPLVATPIRCVLDDQQPWVTIDSVFGLGGTVPSANQAARGSSLWSVLRFEDKTGKTEYLTAERPNTTTTAGRATPSSGPAKIVRHQLFGPLRDRPQWAYELSHQVEGYAIARMRLPRKWQTMAGTGATHDVELAWANLTHGSAGQAKLSAGRGPAGPRWTTHGTQPRLLTGMLSVSPGGIFVHAHDDAAHMFFVDVAGQATPPLPLPSWPATGFGLSARTDAVMAGGTPLAVAMMWTRRGHVAVVGLSPSNAPTATVSFTTLAPPERDDLACQSRWDYRAGAVGITTHCSITSRNRAWASFSAFRANGTLAAPDTLPTQLDLGAQPASAACTPSQRLTARLLAPQLPGTRHPVLVRSSSDAYVLLTDVAVLHGTPTVPCVAAWQATPTLSTMRLTGTAMSAIIGGDLKQGWLFRHAPGTPRSLDYRPMACQLDPNATVPPEVYRESNTSRARW